MHLALASASELPRWSRPGLSRVGGGAGESQGKLRGTGVGTRFGAFVIHPDRRQLLRDGAEVHLTPKAFDLLTLLMDRAPSVVSKAELHRELWPGTFVSDATLVGLVKELRRALRDDGQEPAIRTAHRVGYAFARPADAGPDPTADASHALARRRQATDRPREWRQHHRPRSRVDRLARRARCLSTARANHADRWNRETGRFREARTARCSATNRSARAWCCATPIVFRLRPSYWSFTCRTAASPRPPSPSRLLHRPRTAPDRSERPAQGQLSDALFGALKIAGERGRLHEVRIERRGFESIPSNRRVLNGPPGCSR